MRLPYRIRKFVKIVKRRLKPLEGYREIRRYIKPLTGQIIFDVGANRGQAATELTKNFPGATIYSIEPYGPSFNRLKETVAKYPNVHAHCIGLGTHDGKSLLFTNEATEGNSLLPVKADLPETLIGSWNRPVGTSEVEIRQLDTFCNENGIDRIDVLKLDSQGYELQILEGAAKMLAANRIGCIFTEVTFVDIYEGQTRFEDIYQLLHGHGFRLVDFYEKKRHQEGFLKWCDVLFISAPNIK